MITVHPQFITDDSGKKLSVIIPIKEFENILEELDDMDDVRLYDQAKKSDEESIPVDEAFKLIETKRTIK